VTLLISVWALVTPSGMGKLFLVRVSPGLAGAFLAWHMLAYVATAISANLAIPGLLQVSFQPSSCLREGANL